MDLHELSRILIKVAGISIIIFVLVGVPSYISTYYSLRLTEESLISFFLISILPMLIPLIAGLLLWNFPGTIANKIVQIDNKNAATNSSWGLEIQVIAFAVLGMYLLFNAFSDLIYHLSYYYQTKNINETGYLQIETYSFIVATCTEILFAGILLFGAKPLVELYRKMRYGNSNN